MKQGQASRTASGAAALRANHLLQNDPALLKDEHALQMTTPTWRSLLRFEPTRALMNHFPLNVGLSLLEAQVVVRSCYAEACLADAVQSGIGQYVIVGAGLDTSALRAMQAYPQLKIFEVDHPSTQSLKKQKIRDLGIVVDRMTFVPVDFEKERLSDALVRCGFATDQPAFFSWLGTTHYLTPAATLATLKNIAEFAQPSSQVVLDYSVDYKELNWADKLGLFVLHRITHSMGEPIIGMLSPSTLHQQLGQMGYHINADLTGAQLSQLYQIKHTTAAHMLKLSVKAK